MSLILEGSRPTSCWSGVISDAPLSRGGNLWTIKSHQAPSSVIPATQRRDVTAKDNSSTSAPFSFTSTKRLEIGRCLGTAGLAAVLCMLYSGQRGDTLMSDAIMAATGESVAVDGWCILIGVTDYTLSDGQTGAAGITIYEPAPINDQLYLASSFQQNTTPMAEAPEVHQSSNLHQAKSKSFFDIEKVVTEWAWTKYDTKPTRKQKALRDKQQRKNQPYIGVRIDWSDCEFIDRTTWSPIADERNAGSATTGSALRAAHAIGNDVNVLFQTEFTNNTKSEQMYTMKIDKSTRSTCSTEVESGITRGYELGVTLKLPEEILEMNAGYRKEVTLTTTSGQSFEEELSWGAESEIKVDRNSIAQAQLLVKEKRQSGDFEVTTTIRGYVKVTFTNLRDNNSFLMQAAGDISYVVQKYLDKQERLGQTYPHVAVSDDGVVTIVTKGSCKFRYGIKQEVKVDQAQL
ncbi:hypothetical protein LSH36_281g10081 [Paralvinella palmiformis]|uniref:Uncharacterized protein n=1 Tax=Paralvinella palmiformis TaxID=53620 RepID=A0AAD9N1R5_9ANNE|nr:hypothetical protein LSH36_281g10081 [Paralvinella palmiformis]